MAKKDLTQPKRIVNLIIPIETAKEKIHARINEGNKLLEMPVQSRTDLETLRAKNKEWDDFNTELLLRIFDGDEMSNEYSHIGARVMSMSPSFSQLVGYEYNEIKSNIGKLSSISNRLDLFEVIGNSEDVKKDTATKSSSNKKVFLVHGHDEGIRETVARTIEKLALEVIILHEQANKSQTIVEKFEKNSDVGFAVVLLTPDDIGGVKDSDIMKSRARQNVIMELGYFMGTLGRERVCAIYVEGVELPSDYSGILYIPYDENGAWKFLLAKELNAAGIKVDLSKLL